jgi:hypothetical protein
VRLLAVVLGSTAIAAQRRADHPQRGTRDDQREQVRLVVVVGGLDHGAPDRAVEHLAA